MNVEVEIGPHLAEVLNVISWPLGAWLTVAAMRSFFTSWRQDGR